MKKYFIFFALIFLLFIFSDIFATEISFTSIQVDSTFARTYTWQSGNTQRPIIPLDGQWEYRIQEKDEWKNVDVPSHCNYSGEITFRNTFVPDSTFQNRFFRLVCYGINHYSMIFINSKFIGSHSSGYNSFFLNIADGVIKINEKNIIEIKVDTRLSARTTIPQKFQLNGFQATNGIFRSLFLLALPELSIEEPLVEPRLSEDYSNCDLNISIELKDRVDDITSFDTSDNMNNSFRVRAELFSRGNSKAIVSQTEKITPQDYQLTRIVSTSLKFRRPDLWSPDSPSLYFLKIQLIHDNEIFDEIIHRFGIKDLRIQDSNIFLNGKQIILKGINWHEDYLKATALLNPDQLYRDLKSIKQLSANAVRVLNHPPHPMFAQLCDSLGLFVLQDVPIQWVPPGILSTDIFQKHSIDYLREMVVRDRDHVSLFGWGIGGQVLDYGEEVVDFISNSLEQEKAEDQVLYSWHSPAFPPQKSDSTVIQGLSLFGMKRNELETAIPDWLRRNPNSINLIMSFGAPKLGIPTNDESDVLFEEYQVLQLVDAWQTIVSFPEIDGYFVHSLSDFYGNYPSGIFGLNEDFRLRPVGLTDHSRKTRIAYETIRSLYQEGKCRYNPGVDIKAELPGIFPLVGIITLLVLLFMINTRRYFRENFKRIFVHSHGFYVDLRDGRKIPPSHSIFMAAFIVIGFGLVQASVLYFFNSQPQIDHLITLLIPNFQLKSYIAQLSWQPGWAILIFSLVNLFLFLALSIFIKLVAVIIGKRFPFSQALTLPFWIAGNYVLFIGLGMVLFRVFQYSNLVIPAFMIIGANVIWFIFRLIKSIRVVYTWSFNRALITLFFIFGIIIGGLLYFYQYNAAILDYIKFYYQIFGSSLLITSVY